MSKENNEKMSIGGRTQRFQDRRTTFNDTGKSDKKEGFVLPSPEMLPTTMETVKINVNETGMLADQAISPTQLKKSNLVKKVHPESIKKIHPRESIERKESTCMDTNFAQRANMTNNTNLVSEMNSTNMKSAKTGKLAKATT